MSKNPDKNRVLNLDLPPSENSRFQNFPLLYSPELRTLPFFEGWRHVLDIPISEDGQFRTLFFSGFLLIQKFGGGKKDETP